MPWLLQEFALKGNFKEDKVEQEVTASYKADKYAIKASVSPAGKVRHTAASSTSSLDLPPCFCSANQCEAYGHNVCKHVPIQVEL